MQLILGSLLHILGFEFVQPDHRETLNKIFWLSSQDERRESDATLLHKAGQGVRFDIGFIGPGNTEISLDKVSRFEREIELGRSKMYMGTLIIVDRIGANSRITGLAEELEGDIIQMSMKYWPQDVARVLRKRVDYRHELAGMKHSEISDYLREKLATAPLEKFIGLDAELI